MDIMPPANDTPNTSGLNIHTLKHEDGRVTTKLTIFVNGVNMAWVEFDLLNFTKLLAILEERRLEMERLLDITTLNLGESRGS